MAGAQDDFLQPLDEHAFLGRLERWVRCESPTFDAAAVGRMLDLAAADLAVLGASIERIAGEMGFAGAVRARLPHPRAGQPGILVLAHLDTVHPLGTLEALPFRRKDDICHGPGACDMKGGTCLTVEALAALQTAGIETRLPVTVLLTSDEEVGTPSTRRLIEAEARRARYVLVPEPAHGDGVVTGRYAIARFNLRTVGRPSHAGARLADGRSAIREMARRVIEIEGLTGEDCTFSVGVIRGGRWVNCVATTCDAEALSMAKRQADLDRGVAALLDLAGDRNDVRFEVARGVTRPVWEPNASTMALYETARGFAGTFGLNLTHESAGGGSDGNFTGALGIPTLDGLGAKGAGIHTLDEHIEISETLRRGRILKAMLATLG